MTRLQTVSVLLLASICGCGGSTAGSRGDGASGADGGSDGAGPIFVPEVTSTNPAGAAVDVAINVKIAATFSEAMDPTTLTPTTFTLTGPNSMAVTGMVLFGDTTAILVPAAMLTANTKYTATVTTGARDYAGSALAGNFIWSFQTGNTTDLVPPTVTSVSPAKDATGVASSTWVSASFSKPMDPLTITQGTFTLKAPQSVAVPGTVSYDLTGGAALFVPDPNLAPLTVYTATITSGAKDLSGNALTKDVVWSFTTGMATGPLPVALGAANGFAILAGSTVTSTGPSKIKGNLGLSPGTAVTGFPPGKINGAIHAGDPAAALAKLALTTAYNDAAKRSTAPITVAGNLGGQTLVPGLYKSTSTLAISSGDLTLDARGDANATFIFQIASALTTTSGRQVILSGGAKAANIYWQVGSSVTLGTNSVFKGNLLSDQSITITTGATLEGRALTRIGAVTLDASTVTIPAP